MKRNEIKRIVDTLSTGANTHKLNSLLSVVYASIDLYVMNEESDQYYADGVKALHELNCLIHRNIHFNDVLKEYVG